VPAGGVGCVDEVAAGFVGPVDTHEYIPHGAIAEHVGEAVGAEEQTVGLAKGEGLDVGHSGFVIHAEVARDLALCFVVGGFVEVDGAGFEQFGDDGVVAR